MQQVNITEFRQHLPDYLKQVSQGGELQITSRGKIIARVIPEEDESRLAKEMLASLRKTAIVGDVINPVEDEEWTADEENL